jgi:HK97 gp10 family phage protein
MADPLIQAALAAVNQLPEAMTSALKDVARHTAETIAHNAAATLRSKTHGTGKTAESIVVIDQTDRKQFVVRCQGGAGEDQKLPVYLEYGTTNMAPRAFMRPAGDAEREHYRAAVIAAVTKTAGKVIS